MRVSGETDERPARRIRTREVLRQLLGIAAAAVSLSLAAAPPVPRSEIVRVPLRLPVVLDAHEATTVLRVGAASGMPSGQNAQETAAPPKTRARLVELEALMVRPGAPGRYPLALVTHGSPREAAARRRMSAAQLSFQAEELARRGYGASDGPWVESSGRCDAADHERGARESARDLRAALGTLASFPDVDASRVIVIGQSAGGIGTLALAADPPQGLKAVVNFAGGRGSRAPNEICSEDRLVAAFAALGKTARVPSLWIYTENDHYFGPELARRMFAAYRSQGGIGELKLLPAFAEDGHSLFARRTGVPRWRPLLDAFLRENGLPTWDAAPVEPPVADLPPPHALEARFLHHWQRYLESSDHKAFAIAPGGRFAWTSGHYTAEEARAEALEICGLAACRIYAQNDALVSETLVSR